MARTRFGILAIARAVNAGINGKAMELIQKLANDPSANTKKEWQDLAQEALDEADEGEETLLKVIEKGGLGSKGEAEDRVEELHKRDERGETLHVVRLDGIYEHREVTSTKTVRIDDPEADEDETEAAKAAE